ncbi:HET-domain-containing protein, partial [Glonium stellatum]
SSSAFRIASAWLAECLKHHTYCNTPVALEAQLPTRVIDVGSVEGCNDVCLLETEGRMVGSYMALSHCWGGNSHVQTTITTLPAYVSKIGLNALPKTFAGAIRTARQFGIRYLWIDSLCIIQDSPDDWESEASQMGAYYRNALVTISAAHGSNSDAGLFVKRDSLSTQPYLKPLPLYSRSWVLQEQLLSPRTLTYGKSGISWRCQTMRFDERAPLAMKTDDFIKDKPDNHCSPTSDHFTHDWGRLVQDYTSRGMTRQTDKLVAISGIASIISSLKSLEYAAGIWNGSHEMFVQGLLWSASKRGPRLLDVAPSWSWASIECEVLW